MVCFKNYIFTLYGEFSNSCGAFMGKVVLILYFFPARGFFLGEGKNEYGYFFGRFCSEREATFGREGVFQKLLRFGLFSRAGISIF